jgi:hypothetical protein
MHNAKVPTLMPTVFPPNLQMRHFSRSIFCPTASRRYLSFSRIKTTLVSRPLPILHDDLSPVQFTKLTDSLASFVPASWLPARWPAHSSTPIPPAWHLIYFNSSLPEASLLPDGTDPAQSPGMPFVRRMWAGGKLHFASRELRTGADGECEERIADVVVKGNDGQEKVFVTIERMISQDDAPCLTEERTIVFMRARTEAEVAEARRIMHSTSPLEERKGMNWCAEREYGFLFIFLTICSSV